MHRPPPVQKALATPSECLAWVAPVWGLAVVALGGWCVASAAAGANLWVGLSVSVVALAVAVRSQAALARGQLDWVDGQWLWRRRGAATPGRVGVRADLQRVMLLEFRPDAGPEATWAVVVRHGDAPWLAFRRAALGAGQLGRPAEADRPASGTTRAMG